MPIVRRSTPVEEATRELLLACHPALLSRSEIHREIGDEYGVDKALEFFERRGIIHRLTGDDDDFFWPTRTAVVMESIDTP